MNLPESFTYHSIAEVFKMLIQLFYKTVVIWKGKRRELSAYKTIDFLGGFWIPFSETRTIILIAHIRRLSKRISIRFLGL
jgi:hypothetical protein